MYKPYSFMIMRFKKKTKGHKGKKTDRSTEVTEDKRTLQTAGQRRQPRNKRHIGHTRALVNQHRTDTMSRKTLKDMKGGG